MIDADLIIMFGITFCLALPLLGSALDRKKIVWLPILMFMDVPVALGTGILCLGYVRWGVFWWMGIFMVLLSVLLSFGGLWYALQFGKSIGE
jgi:hypothetical protein